MSPSIYLVNLRTTWRKPTLPLCSTIGVGMLNFSVRNGKRWSPHAIATLVSSPQVLLMAYKVKKSVETDRRAFTKP